MVSKTNYLDVNILIAFWLVFFTAKTKSIHLVSRRVMREQSTALQQTVSQNGQGHMYNGWSSTAGSSWLFGHFGSQLSSATTAEIQCSVNNVFPLPELTIYQVLSDSQRPRSLKNARYTQNVTQLPNGAFSMSVTALIEDTELFHEDQTRLNTVHTATKYTKPTTFECLVTQDVIRHELRNRTTYSPLIGKCSSVGDNSSHTSLYINLTL